METIELGQQNIDLSNRVPFSIEDLKISEAPQLLLDICTEASTLWKKFFCRADLDLLYKYGFDDLLFRMKCQVVRERRRGLGPDYEKRARIWHHVACTSSEGKSEAPEPSQSDVKAWLPTVAEQKTQAVSCLTCGKRFQQKIGSKFGSCRTCRGNKLRAKEIEKAGTMPENWKRCYACQEPFGSKRADAMYCVKQVCQKKRTADRVKALRTRKEAQSAILPTLPVESYVSTGHSPAM